MTSATIEEEASVLAKLASTMVEFDPRFEILPGTQPQPIGIEDHNPYEAGPGTPIPE